MSIKTLSGKYHGMIVTASLDIENRSVKLLTLVNKEGKEVKSAFLGKSFENLRKGGNAAYNAITDYEKLPRLGNERFMGFKTSDGQLVHIGGRAKFEKAAKAPKAEKAPKAAKSENVTKNDAVAKKTKADRKAGPVKVTKAAKAVKPAKGPKSSEAAKSSDSDDLDF